MNTLPSTPVRRACLRLAVLSLLVLSAFLPSAPALTITQTKLGNVFYMTETVSFQLSGGAGNTVQWTATDYFGGVAGQGSVTLSGGSAVLSPNLGRRGYFDLELVEKNGSTTVDTKLTSFAVLTPIDVSTMGSSPFGVMTHFAQNHVTDQLPLLARAGIAHHRDEQYWNQIENPQGVYSFPSKFTGYMSAAAAQSIQPLIVLSWSNQFYDFDEGQFTAPYTDTGRQGYANYALSLLNRYGSQIKFFEVWNEYNAGTFIKGPATADKDLYYYRMLKKVHEEVKAVRPDVQILAGGTVPVAHGFLRDVFAQGAMPYPDAVSVHPYRSIPEGVDLEISELRNLIKSYNNNQEKPIWATEFSMSVGSVAEQYNGAAYLARITTLMLSQNVARIYYYLNQDDANFPYRGLLSSATGALGKYAPHPPYVAYANLIRQLYGWSPAGRVSGTASTTYIYKFTNGSNVLHVLWATAPTSVTASASGNRTRVDLMGEESTLVPSAGIIAANLDENPIFIKGSISSIVEATNPVIADSVADYSKTQGQNGWYYGYANLGSNDPYSTANFQQMSWNTWKADNYRWLGTAEFHYQGIVNAHPASAWAIRRWVSDTAGTVTLSGRVDRGSSAGDGVRFRVFVGGTQVLNQFIAPAGDLAYNLPGISVQVGTQIDFAITQEGNNANDATGFTARVTLTAAPLNITTSSLPAGRTTVNYGSQQLAATGGTPPYTWSLSAGALPAGLSLSSSGVISGTPTTAGTANFTARVTDSASQTDTQPLSITIAANSVPNITTTSLPGATVGAAYSQPVTSTGGDGALTWSVLSGSLPPGLSLTNINSQNATISGTPTSAGTSNFTLRLADVDNNADTQALSIVVSSGGGSTDYQAESAVLAGGVQALSGNSGYTGTGYADYPSSGGYVQWTVNVPAAGTYTLQFRYANGDGVARTLTRTVNGSGSTVTNFPSTGSFSAWSTVNANVTLNAGNNTVRMTGPGSTPGGPNVDKLTVIGPN